METTTRIPKLTTTLRYWKWGLLVVMALALTLTSGHKSAERAEAQIDITGQWNVTLFVGLNEDCKFIITQAGTALTALVACPSATETLTGVIDTATGIFKLEFLGGECPLPLTGFGVCFQGTVSGNSMSGPWQINDPVTPLIAAGIFTGTLKKPPVSLPPLVSCSDIWVNIAALAAQNPDILLKGQPHQPGDILVAKALTRIEPSQKQPGAFDITSVTYSGPDTNGDLLPDQPPTKLDCQQKSDQADGSTAEQQFKAVVPLPTFDRIDVDVVDDGVSNKLLSVTFECQQNGEVQPGVKKLSVEPNPGGGSFERWGATFSKKCIDSLPGHGVTMTSFAVDVNNQWELKDCVVSNGPTTEQCNLNKIDSAPISPQIDKLTVKNPAYDRIDVDIPNATVDKLVKSVLFRCQNSGEKVFGQNKGIDAITDVETWGATFVQKCISDKPGEGVELFLNPVAAPVTISACQVENIGTGAQASCIIAAGPPPPAPAGERGVMNPLVKFLLKDNMSSGLFDQFTSKRPTATAKIVVEGPVDTLRSSTCEFSEALKVWVRTDTNLVLTSSGPGAKNFGTLVLYLGTDSPTDPNDGTTCAILPETIVFPAYLESHVRDATTDHPLEQKNIDNAIALDPDGPQPKVKGVTQDPDADLFADDWDGDGCPDWDELDKSFINGRDPFNPTDCNVDDFTGSYNILLTFAPAAKQGQITGQVADVVGVVSIDQKFDPTAAEDGITPNTCNDGIDQLPNAGADKDDPNCLGKYVSAQLKVDDPNLLKNNQKVYWNSDASDQVGWWQVETGSIADQVSGVSKLVTLNRLFSPPCGLVTLGIPVFQPPAPGQLLGVECVGDVQQGFYFHCISRIDEAPDNVLDSNIACYLDAPLLTITGPQSALPSFADGNAGPPPPPPYGTAAPSKLNGTFDKANQQVFLSGCFENIGGVIGPNMVWEMHVDAHSLKGFTDIWFNRTIAECDAKKPNANDPPTLRMATVLARQNINFDHDGDGCSDYDELGHGKIPAPAKKNCGDDPYNPYDSDADANGVISIQVTQVRADWDKGLDELIPGFYFHCIANNVHDLGTNAVTSTAVCYTDNTVLTINCEDVAGNVKGAGGCSLNASVCGIAPLADASQCGDGLPGSPPPAPYGDMDGSHAVGTGTYDKVTNVVTTDTCFEGVESVVQGPNIYARTKFNIHTGQGTVQIATARIDCTKPDFADTITYPPVLAEAAPQPPNWDSDLDGCTDAQELGPVRAIGGLRDPYNRWDLIDVWVNGVKDKTVNILDIGAIVKRFGSVGDPTGDPLVPPTALTGFDAGSDRSPPLIGSKVWNLGPPDGVINLIEIGEMAASFGNTCQ